MDKTIEEILDVWERLPFSIMGCDGECYTLEPREMEQMLIFTIMRKPKLLKKYGEAIATVRWNELCDRYDMKEEKR